MTVTDPGGQRWSVKQSVEGPVEVVLSRVLSALGYHQPPVYFLRRSRSRTRRARTARGGRFDRRSPTRGLGDWSWQQNPFVGAKPYQGLLVMLMMFGSADLKNSNNSLYASSGRTARSNTFTSSAIGNALGDTGRFASTKNDPDVFERQPFIGGVRRVRRLPLQRLAPGAVPRTHHPGGRRLGRRPHGEALRRAVGRCIQRRWLRPGGCGPLQGSPQIPPRTGASCRIRTSVGNGL